MTFGMKIYAALASDHPYICSTLCVLEQSSFRTVEHIFVKLTTRSENKKETLRTGRLYLLSYLRFSRQISSQQLKIEKFSSQQLWSYVLLKTDHSVKITPSQYKLHSHAAPKHTHPIASAEPDGRQTVMSHTDRVISRSHNRGSARKHRFILLKKVKPLLIIFIIYFISIFMRNIV